MADRSDADIPQVLRRLAPEQIAVDVVLAKRRRILFEAEFPQPTRDVHAASTPVGHRHRCTAELYILNQRDQNDRRTCEMVVSQRRPRRSFV